MARYRVACLVLGALAFGFVAAGYCLYGDEPTPVMGIWPTPCTNPLTIGLVALAWIATLRQAPMKTSDRSERLMWWIIGALSLAFPLSGWLASASFPQFPIRSAGWTTGLTLLLLAAAQLKRDRNRNLALVLIALAGSVPMSMLYGFLQGSTTVQGDMTMATVILLLALLGANLLRLYRHPLILTLLSNRAPGRILRYQVVLWLIISTVLPMVLRTLEQRLMIDEAMLMAVQVWVFIAAALFFSWQFNRVIDRNRHTVKRMRADLDRDWLTGAATRRAAVSLFTRLQARGPVGVILFDIDHFKAINDVHGHVVGDHVLQTVVAEVRPEIPDGAFLARWGGEEFLVVVPVACPHALSALAERMRQRFRNVGPMAALQGMEVSASFGCYLVDDAKSEGLEHALMQADGALYRAKLDGRDRVCMAPQTKAVGADDAHSHGAAPLVIPS